MQLSDIHHQPATYEIIGDLFVDFSFICSNANVKRSEPSLDFRVKEPEIGGKKIRVKDSSQDKVVIASRGSSSKGMSVPSNPHITNDKSTELGRMHVGLPNINMLLWWYLDVGPSEFVTNRSFYNRSEEDWV